MDMSVRKRDGTLQKVDSKKVLKRIENLCAGIDRSFVDVEGIAKKVVDGVFDGVTTEALDCLAAEIAASMVTKHPHYSVLAARIAVSNHHKQTLSKFSHTMIKLRENLHVVAGKRCPLISEETFYIVLKNADILDAIVDYGKDFEYSYFGFKTLERSYLLRINGVVVERPQDMLMRVALGIHGVDINSVIKTYQLMSQRWFIHASPTLFNAGTNSPQLASCFLLTLGGNSTEEMFETLKKCAVISKAAGGIGLNIHSIPGRGSSKVGASDGIVPLLRVFNNTARYASQGESKRPGAFAIYLEPWHADILEFLDLKKNTGCEEERARDLFYALWIPDLFMERVKQDGVWSLMCPVDCPGLEECWGAEFDNLYCQYENEGRFRRQLQAREIWKAVVISQIETGTPYMLYKDACNAKSNQKNLGTIKCSNLCTEIVEFSSPDEVAVCNLASVALPRFVKRNGEFDYQKLHEIVKVVAVNLNKVIDVSSYPVSEAEKSNKRHRPIGIGAQGLADAFQLMAIPFVSPEAKTANKLIFETIYHASLEASMELAQKEGAYASYQGSPISNGILQCDMWGVIPSSLWDWAELRSKIVRFGIRNSLLVAPMPTASTAQILGNNEALEPYTSNIYSRRVLSGDFQIVNPHLLKQLLDLNIWNETLKMKIISNGGSIQNISGIPDHLKEVFKTAWEIKQRDIIDMAADRAPFIDQSQSLNIFMATPSYAKCTSMHIYAWEKGLKTGMYYLRSRPAVDAVQFTVDKTVLNDLNENQKPSEEPCLMCSG